MLAYVAGRGGAPPRLGARRPADVPGALRRDFVPVAHSRGLVTAEEAAGMPAGRARIELVPGAGTAGLLKRPEVAAGVVDWITARFGKRHGGRT
ncbi:hypothetical protein NKH77_21735 [Streptomyces sp. M19]